MPSGALGGIDAIRAARGRLDRVTLTTTKPPRGLAGAPGFAEWESREISEPTVVFDGPAVEAVKLFPANVNVAATLSLAGLGAQETRVKVVADPNSTVNVHEVEAVAAWARSASGWSCSPTSGPRPKPSAPPLPPDRHLVVECASPPGGARPRRDRPLVAGST